MPLLSEAQLIWSPVVANSRMNRSRNAAGINSYEQEFKFRPHDFLEAKIREKGNASWLDICCGEGLAAIQTAGYFHDLGQSNVTITGIDLVDAFHPAGRAFPSLNFIIAAAAGWQPSMQYDLIT